MIDEKPVLKALNEENYSKSFRIKEIMKDKDVVKLSYWYTFFILAIPIFLFIDWYVSAALALAVFTNARVMSNILTNKLATLLRLLKVAKEESESITYNKNLTEAINLLFHNDRVMRETGRDTILTDFPQHSEVIISAERIFEDGNVDEGEDFIPKKTTIVRLN